MTSAFIRKIAILLAVLLFAVHVKAAADAKDKLDKLMKFYVVHDHFNGTVLIVRKGGTVLTKGYGYQDIEKKIPNDERTIFQVGGLSMQFTAELMLLLDSQGKLGLDNKVSKYLPDFPNGNRITIRHLLTQTSGLYDYTSDAAVMGDSTKGLALDSLMSIIKSKPLAFEPGGKYQFTNTNFAVLGYIVETITHWNLEDQIKTKIFHVCGMYHSGFDFVNMKNEHRAKGYTADAGGVLKEATIIDSSLSYGGGNAYTTADDLQKWHKALMNYVLMPQDWQDVGYVPLKYEHAWGWDIQHLFQKKFLEQGGVISGFSSYIVRQLSDDVLVVLLQNRTAPIAESKVIAHNIVKCLYDANYKLPVADNMAAEQEADARAEEKVIAIQDEEDRIAAAERKAHPVIVAEPKKIIEKPEPYVPFIGEYITDPVFSVLITHIGAVLYAQATSQDIILLKPDGSNPLLYNADGGKTVEFVKDEQGNISKLIYRYNGKQKEAIKKIRR